MDKSDLETLINDLDSVVDRLKYYTIDDLPSKYIEHEIQQMEKLCMEIHLSVDKYLKIGMEKINDTTHGILENQICLIDRHCLEFPLTGLEKICKDIVNSIEIITLKRGIALDRVNYFLDKLKSMKLDKPYNSEESDEEYYANDGQQKIIKKKTNCFYKKL